MMDAIIKVLRYLRFTITLPLLFGIIPIYFSTVFVLKILTLPFPVWVYRQLDDVMYSCYLRNVLFLFFNVTGTKLYYSGDYEKIMKNKENVLYMANHVSGVDWILTNLIAIYQGSINNVRYILKHEMQCLPFYGLIIYQHGCVYVNRTDFKMEKMIQNLEYLNNKNIPSWIAIFPEGTFYKPEEKHTVEKSQQRAIDNKFPILENHLTPKSKAIYLTLKQLRHQLDAVYDITVVYGNSVDENGHRVTSADVKDFLLGKCPFVNIHIRRIPLSEIPVDEDLLKIWLHKEFIKKDKLVEDFYNPDPLIRESALKRSTPHSLKLQYTLPSVLLCTFIVMYVLYTILWFYFIIMVFGCISGYFWFRIKSVC